MGEPNIITGGFTQADTAIAVDLEIGFVPKHFRIINTTDAIVEEWNDQMTDAHGFILGSTFAEQTTADGITPIDGDSGTIPGVTFGLDTTINIADKVYVWSAWRR